ncbi:MAG TPA: class I SAM-dependent DNA methyltransferase [Solirubrobacterales bacterium]|jgi:type I restriction enzyme M protein|nr:class I SAM-dependent DNA methyltransferase [Solirubrobacterales bacterium]
MTSETAGTLVRKLWQYCNILRDDGLSYPDYVEQLTYLLFLKMADERSESLLPAGAGWQSFSTLDAPGMHPEYERVLHELSKCDGILGLIFRDARNKISDPAKLRVLVVDLVGQTEWSQVSGDVKGDAYEGLLDKNARDTKSGAGQYFTPRPLVEAIVECVDPTPGETVVDPACGTGGFLLAAHAHILGRHKDLNPKQLEELRTKSMRGVELVQEVARLAAMNLFLHGIGSQPGDPVPIAVGDSLRTQPTGAADVVLTNPPFGIKGSVGYSGERRSPSGAERELENVRADLQVKTNNKQLNFLQHIMSLLSPMGRAAVVIPDNVLFEGGAAASIRRRLLSEFHTHTLLRLPAGLFYAAGVLSNVLFFDGPKARRGDGRLWVYDFRTANRFSVKTKPVQLEDLTGFISAYGKPTGKRRSDEPEGARWKSFNREMLLSTPDCAMDLTWSGGPEDQQEIGVERMDEIAVEIGRDLEQALSLLRRAGSGS